MYELSLTAVVENENLSSACAVLTGLCGMPPWETVHRILYYQGPSKPKGFSNLGSAEKPTRRDIAVLWKDMHQALCRQSFILQARYEVSKEQDFGPSSKESSLDATQGILRWADFPDPPQGRPMLLQRKKIEIWDQQNLPSIMKDNNYQFKTETVEQVYRFYRDDVEFCLWRQLFPRSMEDYMPLNPQTSSSTTPLSALPAWDSIAPVDLQNRWFLQVKVHVVQDNKPDEVRKAQDQLMAVKAELEGCFDFRSFDRKAQDTRIALQQQGVQALPQKVTLGKA